MSNFEQKLRACEKPGVQLIPSDKPTKSHLGGEPNLPAGVEWPTWRGRKLACIGRVSLSDLHKEHPIEWLPKTGALLFFYDAQQEAWGFDPADKGCCRVIHVPDLDEPVDPAGTQVAPTQGKPRKTLWTAIRRLFFSGFEPGTGRTDGGALPFPCLPVAFRLIQTLPDAPDVEMTDDESDAYMEELESRYGGLPAHMVAGLPYAVQSSEMDLECQLVTNGLNCGDPRGYDDPRAKELESGRSDWQLLLQVDSDEERLKMMWGDCGVIYFWVRAEEATAGNFENVWLILQCC